MNFVKMSLGAVFKRNSGRLWRRALAGGQTAINGVADDDLQRNWRAGATLSFPFAIGYSVRLYASRGVAARTHDNYDLIGIQLQYRWGGGL